jgi:hypothetical protein
MNQPDKPPRDPSADEPQDPRLDDDEVRSLLRRAMQLERAAPPPDVLHGVQKKIRQRSRGKFFADGWSTEPSPKSTYFVTAIVMLALLVALYFSLAPSGWGAP